MEKQILNQMFDNLLHIGNKINFWNPRMAPYIYGSVNGVHVFNLISTNSKIEEVVLELKGLVASGKKILFVATKLQSRDAFRNLSESVGAYYVSEKWVPGLLTNFKTIKTRIGTYIKLKKDFETGAFEGFTKKEIASKKLELEKLEKAYSGLVEMKKLPDAIFVADGIYEDKAVEEAKKLGIPVYAVFNTNGDDFFVQNLIPANTNSVKSMNYVAERLKPAFDVKIVAGNTSSKPVSNNNSKVTKISKEKLAEKGV